MKATLTGARTPNLEHYDSAREGFSWKNVRDQLDGLPEGRGLNIAYEAVDRHALGALRDTVALRFVGADFATRDFTYTDLREQSALLAAVLHELGVSKGERVFTLAGRIPELYLTALAALRLGAVYCPLFSVFGPEPVFQRLSRGDAAVLVTTALLYEKKVKPLLDKLPALRHVLLVDANGHDSEQVLSLPLLMERARPRYAIAATQPEDPALLHFTSGSTGMPKGALHVHQAVLTHYITGRYVLDFQPGDVFWCTADPGWVTGTSYGIISPLVNGVTALVDEQEFDAARWYRILEEQKVNIWYTAPTAIRRLMRMEAIPRETYDLSALRVVLSVGEPLNPEAVVWGEKALGMPILDNWWQTELGGIMIANYRAMPVRPGSMGKPLPGVEAAIAELRADGLHLLEGPDVQGHLVLKRDIPSLFRGYLHEEERYARCFRDGWYLSGDLARRDAEGYFWFVGRADDIIKTSGHMVGPFEVESTLMTHPAVLEAAVIGKPEPSIGELVKAFVVLKPTAEAGHELRRELMAHARREMGPAVAPKEIEFVESLPKTRSGKIMRRLLKARELGLPEGDTSTLE
jgi:acetyl-CoA synthetase